MVCTLRTEITVTSMAKFLRVIPMRWFNKFILNEPFNIRFRFKNVSENGEIYLGGNISIRIDWQGGAPEFIEIPMPKLKAEEPWEADTRKDLRVHNVGMGTVILDSANPFLHLKVDDRIVRPNTKEYSIIHGIPATNWSEVYTLIALLINTAVLVFTVLRDIGALRWLHFWITHMLDP